MLYYRLNKEVFITKGGKNSLIYDLNKRATYKLDNDAYNFIRGILKFGVEYNKLDEKQKDVYNKLLENDLLQKCEKPERIRNITSLKKDIKPESALFEVTQQCNLNCVFCYEKSDYNNKNYMSYKDFEKARDFVINYGIKKVKFIGGEPMLNSNLKDMISSCYKKFDSIEIYTNGTLINQDWCDFFKKYNVTVEITCPTLATEENKKIIQTNDSRYKVSNMVKLLTKSKVNFSLSSIKIKGYNIQQKTSEDEKYIENIKQWLPKLTGRCNIGQYDLEMFKKIAITEYSFARPLDREEIIRNVSGHNCFNRFIYIAYNLEIFPCPMEKRISHGFIKDSSDMKIIKSNIWKDYCKDKIKICRHCEYRYMCHDCRPDSNGAKVNCKPWNCTYDPINGLWTSPEEMFNKLSLSSSVCYQYQNL